MGTLTFMAYQVSTGDEFQKLQEICSRVGVKAEFAPPDPRKKKDLGLLYFSWDDDKTMQKLTRDAGRKYKVDHHKYTVAEVKRMIDERGAMAAAHEIGISKSRMYARLKEAEFTQSECF